VRVGAVASRRVVFEYRVEGADGSVLAEGETRHVVVDRTTGRPTVLPAELRASLERTPSQDREAAETPTRTNTSRG